MEDGRIGLLTNGICNTEPLAFSPHLHDHLPWIDECCFPNIKQEYTSWMTPFSHWSSRSSCSGSPRRQICSLIYLCRPMCLPETGPTDWDPEIKRVHLSEVLAFSSSTGSQSQINLGGVECLWRRLERLYNSYQSFRDWSSRTSGCAQRQFPSSPTTWQKWAVLFRDSEKESLHPQDNTKEKWSVLSKALPCQRPPVL